MSAEYSPQLEPSQKAAWLAGLFEASGHMGFYFSGKQRYPQVEYGSKDIDPLFILQVFGGNISHGKDATMSWNTKGSLAQDIGIAINGLAPSRAYFTKLLEDWDLLSHEEKTERIFQSREESRNGFPSKELYEELVNNDQFVAGVVDARGDFEQKTGRVRMTTPNKSLLEALNERYPGKISVTNPAGKTFIIRGKEGTIARSVHVWNLGVAQTRALAEDVQNHVLFKFDAVKGILQRAAQLDTQPLSPYAARRLAYLLEQKGVLNFHIAHNKRGEKVASPRIRITSKERGFLQSLQQEIGGSVYFNTKKGYGEWNLHGEPASYAAIAITPWYDQLSQKINDHITAFTAWLSEETQEGRVAIAEQFCSK